MIIKSKNDNLQYLFHQLSNGIKCILIHSKKCNKSACSLNVHTGSLNDPKNSLGLSHLLEHMLFMGTKKYKKENYFQKILNENNGSSNAYTQLNDTNYFFDIDNRAFKKGLDIFSYFFKSPLINESSLRREIMAVHSEHMKNINSDMWRLYQFIFEQFDKDSYYHNIFPTGNLSTLNQKNIRIKLIEYFNTYYSSNRMSLCLLSPFSFDEMKIMLHKNFSKIKRNFIINDNKENVQLKCGYIYKISPVENKSKIIFQYHIPMDINEFSKYKPYEILKSIINSKKNKSLYDILFSQNNIINLHCDYENFGGKFAKFFIEVELNKKGKLNVNTIIKTISKYVNDIIRSEIDEKYIDQLQLLGDFAFRFEEKENEIDICSNIASRLPTIKNVRYILKEPYEYKKSKEIVKRCFQEINEKNLNIILLNKKYEKDTQSNFHLEKWYNMKYIKERINPQLFHEHTMKSKIFSYPGSNKYIPTELNVIKGSNDSLPYPKMELMTNTSTLYYKKDNSFNIPKIYLYMRLNLDFSKILLTTKDKAIFKLCNFIWRKIILNEFKDELELINQAGVNISFHFDNYGFVIMVNGYSQKIKLITKDFLTKLKHFIFSTQNLNKYEVLFDSFYNDFQRQISNYFLLPPYRQILGYYKDIIHKDHITTVEISNVLKTINKKEVFNEFFKEHLRKIICYGKLTWLIQGNILKNQAIELVKKCEGIIPLKPLLKANKPNSVFLTQNKDVSIQSINKNEKNNALLLFYQANSRLSQIHKKDCELKILSSLLNEQYFNSLRTKHALGYIVTLFPHRIINSRGICLLVQSNYKSPIQILSYNKSFLEWAHKYIKGLSQKELKKHINSQISLLNQKDPNLYSEFTRNINEIDNHTFCFNRSEIQKSILKQITKKDIVQSFNRLFLPNTNRLSVSYYNKYTH